MSSYNFIGHFLITCSCYLFSLFYLSLLNREQYVLELGIIVLLDSAPKKQRYIPSPPSLNLEVTCMQSICSKIQQNLLSIHFMSGVLLDINTSKIQKEKAVIKYKTIH